jgi:hypothetical protein
MILLRLHFAAKIVFAGLLLALVVGRGAYAEEPSATVPLSSEQAQARQFGIFFGGLASQYDLCAQKEFLPKGEQPAEEIAKAILEKMRTLNKGPDEFAFVQDGWDTMKKEISENPSFYTQEKCSWVGKEWAKTLVTMHWKGPAR